MLRSIHVLYNPRGILDIAERKITVSPNNMKALGYTRHESQAILGDMEHLGLLSFSSQGYRLTPTVKGIRFAHLRNRVVENQYIHSVYEEICERLLEFYEGDETEMRSQRNATRTKRAIFDFLRDYTTEEVNEFQEELDQLDRRYSTN